MGNCGSCGAELPGPVAFCPTCGKPTERRGEPQRRFLTVLFVDLVGFTADSDQADPEDVQRHVAPFHELVRTEIERYGGTVEKFIGDGVMGVFGVPSAHEDDPERAVRVGLRILEGAEALDRSEKDRFAVRIGIDSGVAMVTPGGNAEHIVGDVVNTASRLESAADPGTVVVGEPTYRASRLTIDYEDLGEVRVKGKAEALSVWRALAPRSRFGVDMRLSVSDSPFVGREAEMEVLQDVFRRVAYDGALQLVTVAAPPGAGKSRLVAEFRGWVDSLPEIVTWRQGRCLPYGEGVSFWALGEVVKAHAGILESDGGDAAGEKLSLSLEALGYEGADRRWMAAQLGLLVAAATDATPGDRVEAVTAWRRFLEDLAQAGPLVLLLEDIHWADGTFIEFLEDVLVWSAGSPILLICTARPELYEEHPRWGGGQRGSTTLNLPALSDDEMSRLIGHELGTTSLPESTSATLLTRAEGNPLYAQEFVRMLSDRGMVDAGGALTLDDGSAVPVPETVQSLLASRLDVLADDELRALEDAAVVGAVFWEDVVARMSPHPDLRASLRGLVAREWVHPLRTSSVAGQAEYAFHHALTRDVAYERIPRLARAEKHAQVADWIRSTAGDRGADQAELLVHHDGRALELARAAGRSDTRQLEAASRASLVLAGDRTRLLDPLKALAFYARALAMPGDDDGETARTMLKKGALLADSLDRGDQSLGILEEAAVLAEAAGDSRTSANAKRTLAFASWYAQGGDYRADLVDEAIVALEALGPSSDLAEAYGIRAAAEVFAGRPEGSLEWTGRAIALFDELGTPTARSYYMRGMAKFDLGDVDGALLDLRHGADVAAEHVLPMSEAFGAYANLAEHVWLIEGSAPALQTYDELFSLLEPRGLDPAQTRGQQTWPSFDAGAWDRVLVTVERLRGRDEVDTASLVWSLPYAALIHAWRGEHEEAEGLLGVVGSYDARAVQERSILLYCNARAAYAAGDSASAVEGLDELARLVEDGPFIYRLRFVTDVVRMLAGAGEIEDASRWASSKPGPAKRGIVSLQASQPIIAEAAGEDERAASLYLAAAAAWDDFGHTLECALAHAGAARCLGALGRTVEAETERAAARVIIADLGVADGMIRLDRD